MKKLSIIITIIFAVFLILYKVIFIIPIYDNNIVINEINSPNNQYRAIIFERNINATTRSSYHLSILKNGQVLNNVGGNVFVSYNNFDVEWINNDVLKVNNDRENSKLKKVHNYKNIKVIYSYWNI